jgi:hypothetical protein
VQFAEELPKRRSEVGEMREWGEMRRMREWGEWGEMSL